MDAKQSNLATTRRTVLRAAASLPAAALALPAIAQARTEMTFAIWGGQAEIEAYRKQIAKYEALHPNVTIKLDIAPSGNPYYQRMDTQLAGGKAPDLFRIQYQLVGKYASAKGIVDLSPALPAGYADDFLPTLWTGAQYDGRTFALPHHTDTFAVFYNKAHFAKIGVTPPSRIEDSWRWQEFIDVARKLKASGQAPYPMAMAWIGGVAYRWMVFLYQHGGQLLSDDGKRPMMGQKPGIETIAWTQSWFTEGLVPKNTSIKSTEVTQNLFANGTISMLLNGEWQIPFILSQAKFDWGVTYMPRDVNMGSDFGGTCVCVTRDARNKEVATDFAKFLVDGDNMRDFITAAQFLPARRSLAAGKLDFPMRPDVMPTFVEQAQTVSPSFAKTIVRPDWAKMNLALADELDLAFTAGQDPATTARNIDDAVREILET